MITKELAYTFIKSINEFTVSLIDNTPSKPSENKRLKTWRSFVESVKPNEDISWGLNFPDDNGVVYLYVNVWLNKPTPEQLRLLSELEKGLKQTFDDCDVVLESKTLLCRFKVNQQKNVAETLKVLEKNEAKLKQILKVYFTHCNEKIAGLKGYVSSKVLHKKNDKIQTPSIENLTIKLKWFKEIDFDLAALYLLKNGEKGLIYFANKGDVSKTPYINLNVDAMYKKENEEILTIAKLKEIEELYLICWDYTGRGGTGAFSGASTSITMIDSNKNSVIVNLNSTTGYDAACIAKVYSQNNQYMIENMSEYFKKPSSNSTDLLNILRKK
jgi:uncharacterized protein involved in tellurium resistance